jgi:hypothetical protein
MKDLLEKKPVLNLAPLIADWTDVKLYTLPELRDSEGKLRPIIVTFDDLTAQFARYDKVKNQILIYNWLLSESHEGGHNVTVSFSFGKGIYK